MKGTTEDVLKSIPDFDDFMKLAGEISSLMYKKLSVESQLRYGESLVFKGASTNDQYFVNGKPPSASYIENTYKYSGFNKELLPLREELARVTAELEGKRLQMDIYKSMIDVWRTLSSNSRAASL